MKIRVFEEIINRISLTNPTVLGPPLSASSLTQASASERVLLIRSPRPPRVLRTPNISAIKYAGVN